MSTSARSSILGVSILSLKGSLFNSASNIEPPRPKTTTNAVQPAKNQVGQPAAKKASAQPLNMYSSASATQSIPTDAISSEALPVQLSIHATETIGSSPPIPDTEEPTVRNVTQPAIVRRTSIRSSFSREKPKMTVSTFLPPTKVTDGSVALSKAERFSPQDPRANSETVVVNGRKPANSPSTSRSESPSSREDASTRDGDTTPPSSISTTTGSSNTSEASTGDGSSIKLRRRDSISGSPKKIRRPLSMMFSRTTVPEPPVPSVGKSSLANSISASDISSPAVNNTLTKRAKDELADGFKMLETEYNKFQSRAGVQKANLVRISLVSFLRKFKGKTSSGISYDELDRRIRILHRWWTGLLAQLKNRSSNAVTGADRPTYLEGIVGIMSRPEWRPPRSEFAPTCQQIMEESKSSSTTSLASMATESSVRKSVHLNIKTLFTRTLLETLAFAVEKMGLPTAAGTMVAFSGKVLAYAFFFCNGVAEALVDLWEVNPAVVRRVVKTYETENAANLRKISELILESFPSHLHSLGYTGIAGLIRRMKRPKPPPAGSNVDWRGPWIPRWCGRDTDLLFVFLKHYHTLLADYIPPDASNNARLCAPGFAMVMAQTLTVLDSTLHRQTVESPFPAVLEPNKGAISQLTFDDMLANTTVTVPVPNRNSNRPMADNKIVVLLRDLIMQRTPMPEACREEHISAICLMIHSATRSTSIFDADSCFTLCDLFEEIVALLQRAEANSLRGTQFLDWDFWIDVWKRMFLCDNNMTELRVICLLYSIWPKIAEDKGRKRNLCIDWLLTGAVWDRFFTHWCPMVRAYYMRLICWKCVRYDGEADEVDMEIYRLVLLRLRTSNNAHLRLKEVAEKNKTAPPSSMPCHPAPGRRLIILRTDTKSATPGSGLLSFDDSIAPTFLPTLESTRPMHTRSTSSFSGLSDDELAELNGSKRRDSASSSSKKRWSFMRSWGFSGPSDSASPTESAPALTSSEKSEAAAANKATPVFKFSLEWLNQPPFAVRGGSLGPARLPRPAHAYLENELQIRDEIPELPDLALRKTCWKYSGRAMSEWIFIVVECENFFERRKAEGKASNAEVETPLLGVDTLKKL